MCEGPVGDWSLRRSRQSRSLLHQSIQDTLTQLVTRRLDELPTYQRWNHEWKEQEKLARTQSQSQSKPQPAAVTGTVPSDATPIQLMTDFVPRVEAMKIVQEWVDTQMKERSN